MRVPELQEITINGAYMLDDCFALTDEQVIVPSMSRTQFRRGCTNGRRWGGKLMFNFPVKSLLLHRFRRPVLTFQSEKYKRNTIPLRTSVVPPERRLYFNFQFWKPQSFQFSRKFWCWPKTNISISNLRVHHFNEILSIETFMKPWFSKRRYTFKRWQLKSWKDSVWSCT